MIKRFWNWFRSPSKSTSLGALLIIGGIGGIIFWGGFNTFMEYTNTLGFCTGCHEMNTVEEEYAHSIHYENNSGVRAICSDCHVPKPWGAKLVRKIKATNEIYHKLLGSIDTPEKFRAKRMELADNVWRSMKDSDSRECRNCHAFESMTTATQRNDAPFWHPVAMDEGFTCIDCHKGIAHELPDMQRLVVAAADKFNNSLAADARSANTLYVVTTAPMMSDKAPGSASVAELLPGARVSVLERGGDLVKVSLQAQEVLGDASRLYSDRIKAATVANVSGTPEYEGEPSEDPGTRISWRTARISGWVNTSALASGIEPAWDFAKAVYENECARCHAVFGPSYFKANEWVHTIKNMRRYADLPEQELDMVLSYLQHNSKALADF